MLKLSTSYLRHSSYYADTLDNRTKRIIAARAPSKGEFHSANVYHHRHLEIARYVGDKLGEANGLWNISLLLEVLGQRANATVSAAEALRIYKEIGSSNQAKVLPD